MRFNIRKLYCATIRPTQQRKIVSLPKIRNVRGSLIVQKRFGIITYYGFFGRIRSRSFGKMSHEKIVNLVF